MREVLDRVPDTWTTDVEVLRLGGSAIEDHGDHLVVRSPHNPGFHWGNFVLVTDPHAVDDADRWIAAFDAEFPDADHLAIGLPAEPKSGPWAAREAQVESELVLSTPDPPMRQAAPFGYAVGAFRTDEDWARAVQLDLDEPSPTGRTRDASFRTYLERLAATRAAMVQRGVAAFFGATEQATGALVARLGIVLCGALDESAQVARFQHVGTRPEHRGRGLAGHLLAVAAEWAGVHGADRWEIHVDAGTPAHRLYSSLGFAPHGTLWQVTREPEA